MVRQAPLSTGSPLTKRLLRAGSLAFFLVQLTTIEGARAQVPSRTAAPRTTEVQLSIARRVMERTRYCALATIDGSGRASLRTIDPISPDSAFVVHFATNPKSRKVRELARDARVTLYYFDPVALAYVSLYGTARRLTDAKAKVRFWKPEWSQFYPNRVNGVALYEVKPERLEVVSIMDGVTGDSVTWSPPTVRRFTPAAARK